MPRRACRPRRIWVFDAEGIVGAWVINDSIFGNNIGSWSIVIDNVVYFDGGKEMDCHPVNDENEVSIVIPIFFQIVLIQNG